MLVGFVCLLVLLGAWLVVRTGVATSEVAGARAAPSTRDRVIGLAAVLLAALPLFRLAPWIHGAPDTHFGDALSHVHVARDIARHGLPHGWVATNLGGFPLGHHYPPLGTLLLVSGIRLGLEPVAAAHLLGFLATLATPIAFYFGALVAGARVASAVLGALYLSWVSPYNVFVGGYETFYFGGLVSQVFGLPLCIAFAASVAAGRAAAAAIWGMFAMSAHPQLAAVGAGLCAVAAIAAGRKDVVMTFARGALAMLLTGAALYGPGMLSLGIPFGWPPAFGWRQVGFDTSRLSWWFGDGDLLDRDRAQPVLTALASVALLTSLCCLRRAPARAGAAAALAALVFSVSGPTLAKIELVGATLLAVLQPVRVLAFVPPIAAGLVTLALDSATPVLRAASSKSRWTAVRVWSPRVPWIMAGCLLAAAFPQRVSYAGAFADRLERRKVNVCALVPSYDGARIRRAVAPLTFGRLWFDEHGVGDFQACLFRDGPMLESGVPLASAAALGAHVGILWYAFQMFEPERAGAHRRAEALGIRHALKHGAVAGEWDEKNRHGELALWSRRGGTDYVGFGCIRERWQGSDRVLRKRLIDELGTDAGADRLLDPGRFTALRTTRGDLSTELVHDAACDAGGASVREIEREPGAFEAEIRTRAPVDVVVRATAFPTWRVRVDGVERPVELVAPGFFAVRVPAGRHRLEAVVSPMPGYLAGIGLAVLGVVALAFVRAEHARRALARLRTLRAARAATRPD